MFTLGSLLWASHVYANILNLLGGQGRAEAFYIKDTQPIFHFSMIRNCNICMIFVTYFEIFVSFYLDFNVF